MHFRVSPNRCLIDKTRKQRDKFGVSALDPIEIWREIAVLTVGFAMSCYWMMQAPHTTC